MRDGSYESIIYYLISKKCFQLFPEIEDVDELNDIMQAITSAWNSFPHKELGGKSPTQIMNEEIKKMPKNTEKQEGRPKVRVGDLEGIRPEFIWEEFPHWWPTYVMQSGLKPAHVKKYLKELFKFIDLVYLG